MILHAGMLVAGGSSRFIVHGEAGTLLKRLHDRQEAQLIAGIVPGAAEWGTDDDALIVFDAEGGERRVPATRGDQRRFYVACATSFCTASATPSRRSRRWQ